MRKHVLICVLSICVAFGAVGQVSYQWVKAIGGYTSDKGRSIVTDLNGNVYISTFLSLSSESVAEFNPYGNGSYSYTPTYQGNCVIAKYDAEGNCLWRRVITSTGINNASFFVNSIAVSPDGLYLYVCGAYNGQLNIESGSWTSTSLKPFLAKYDASGNLNWVNDAVLGSGAIADIALHSTQPSYVFFVAGDGTEAIFGKCDVSNGTMIVNDTIKGAAGAGILPLGIALDDNSDVTITGSFTGTMDFDPSSSVINKTSVGAGDIFLAQYTIGCDYIWAESYGGPGQDIATDIAFNSSGNLIYLTGYFQNMANFGTGAVSVTGIKDGFVAKCDNSNGGVLLLSDMKTLGVTDSVVCYGIAIDANDDVYVSGTLNGAGRFYDNVNSDTLNGNGLADIFFAKYNAGLAYGWAKNIGGPGNDAAIDISVQNGNIYTIGYFNDSVDFNIASGIANRHVSKDPQSTSLYDDIFVLKYLTGSATIKGTVTYGLNYDTINTGTGNKVRLYTQTLFDGNLALNLIAEATIDTTNGFYIFNNVPDGDYLALAVPGDYYASAKYLIPTYYTNDINNDTSFLWQAADTISAQSTAPAFVANINMLKGMPLTGDVQLGGVIMAEEGFFREVKPVAGGIVVVRKNPGHNLVANTETDEEGFYSFSNLPALANDTCYKLYVNITGLPMVSNYNPCPVQGDSIMNLNFVVDSASIDTVVSIINSVSQIKSLKTPLTVYPNPNNGFVTIELAIAEPLFVKIEAYSLLGKKVADIYSDYQPAGLAEYKYNATDKGLKAGVYFLNVSVGSERIIRKIVQVD